MICPNCGKKTKVQETRCKRVVVRVRKCPGCKLRFRTLEKLYDDVIINRKKEWENE